LQELTLRSEKIYRALSSGISRYEVCQLISKGVRATHKAGTRYEDSINNVLDYLGSPTRAHAPEDVSSLKPAA
jgi:uncharacterized protein YoaH (UPF0181 family)